MNIEGLDNAIQPRCELPQDLRASIDGHACAMAGASAQEEENNREGRVKASSTDLETQ